MTKQLFRKTLAAVALLGIMASAQAQYASFFGDSVTEYSLAIQITCKSNPGTELFANPVTSYYEDGITFVSNGEYDPYYIGGCIWTRNVKFIKKRTSTFNNVEYYVLYHGIGWEYPIERDTVEYIYTTGYPGQYYNYYVREDTTLGRLYRYVPETDEEVVICDMSLGTGDSIHLYDYTPILNMRGYYGFNNGSWIHVDSVLYCNNGRKVILFDKYFSYYGFPMYFIEGIGPWFGPVGGDFCEGECNYFPYRPVLLGVRKDYQVAHLTSSKLGYHQDFVDVPEVEATAEDMLEVHPNPTDGTFNIVADDIRTVEVFNQLGQKVLTDRSGSRTINAGGLPAGIYFLKVETATATKYGKLMKR